MQGFEMLSAARRFIAPLKKYLRLALVSALLSSCQDDSNTQREEVVPVPVTGEGYFERQINYLTTVLSNNPKNAQAFYKRAVLQKKIGLNAKAISDIEAALALRWADPGYHALAAVLYLDSGLLDKAERHVDFTEKNGGGDMDFVRTAGIVYNNKGYYEKATDYLSKAAEILPKDAEIFLELGKLKVSLADTAAANAFFAQALAIRPTYPQVYVEQLRMYRYFRRSYYGILVARNGMRTGSGSPELCLEMGKSWEHIFMFDSAAFWYRQALLLKPKYWQASFMLGEHHRKARNYIMAENYYREALKEKPDLSQAQFVVGFINEFYLRNFVVAKQSYLNALKKEPTNAEYLAALRRIERREHYDSLRRNNLLPPKIESLLGDSVQTGVEESFVLPEEEKKEGEAETPKEGGGQ